MISPLVCLSKLVRTVFILIFLLLVVAAILPAAQKAPGTSAPPAPAAGKVDCSTCHDIGANVPKDGSRHAALDMGCDSCHLQHDESATPNPKSPKHLKKAAPALCLDCHDAKDAALLRAHQSQPFAQANCLSCHNPHVGEGPKLTHKFSHPPFAGRDCHSCHLPTKADKVQLVQGGGKALCFTCHADVQERLTKSKVQHGLFKVSDNCTDCHTPHASAHKGQLKQSQVAMCENCHVERATERKTEKFLHKPAFQDGCSVCHEPHASNESSHLRAEVNTLCMTCHAVGAKGEDASDATTLVLFGGKVRLPGNYLEKAKRIDLSSSGKGHPTSNHPTAAIPDPADKSKKGSCVTCHDPHAAKESPALLVTQKRSSSQLCIRCHK